ncbi:ABC transporter permease [Agreia pratensis]|uniref:Peptide/nickel transport system permease protein n=1 Tax=Agreia pratensis TaxID=150121 RepID=A0A1X7ITR6_9MICO|nr:ABC transporter permease [Agreia pratensis]SMG18565.1 peptide/nickel transport system permease protein [Agreia pratensis]
MALSDLATPGVAIASVARNRIPRIGVIVALLWLALLAVGALVAAAGLTADPLTNDYTVISQAPSLAHPFGTDNLGRDVFSRSLHGAGSSAVVALVTVFVGGGLGILLGVWAGLRRGIADAITGFLTDVTIALPSLIIVATVVTLAGPSLPTISLTIAAFAIPVFARLSRSATLSIAAENYVVAARTLGASGWRILTREVLPSVLPVMMPFLMTTLATAIISEGALSFLGFGLRPPEPSWGGLIAEGRTQLALAPWVTLLPALLLCVTILAINVLGEHLREAKR